jgi:hypothetical protein
MKSKVHNYNIEIKKQNKYKDRTEVFKRKLHEACIKENKTNQMIRRVILVDYIFTVYKTRNKQNTKIEH